MGIRGREQVRKQPGPDLPRRGVELGFFSRYVGSWPLEGWQGRNTSGFCSEKFPWLLHGLGQTREEALMVDLTREMAEKRGI